MFGLGKIRIGNIRLFRPIPRQLDELEKLQSFEGIEELTELGFFVASAIEEVVNQANQIAHEGWTEMWFADLETFYEVIAQLQLLVRFSVHSLDITGDTHPVVVTLIAPHYVAQAA